MYGVYVYINPSSTYIHVLRDIVFLHNTIKFCQNRYEYFNLYAIRVKLIGNFH